MKNLFLIQAIFATLSLIVTLKTSSAQTTRRTDANTPLHTLPAQYPVLYEAPTSEKVKALLDRVRAYLEATTPTEMMNAHTEKPVSASNEADKETIFRPGDFRLVSYEWGVTYSGMLAVFNATGDEKYKDYTVKRLKFISDALPTFQKIYEQSPEATNPLRSFIDPHSLDDAGSMAAAMIKTMRVSPNLKELRAPVDHLLEYITKKEYRLPDGTLAENRPHQNSLWLDDLYMSVPALAQMGQWTGEKKYFDDAAKQIRQFSERMFNEQKGIFMHGWVEGMPVHPEFHWARANGWALLAMEEFLDVAPKNHPAYQSTLRLLQSHIRGLAALQSRTGFWHQLLDVEDSYLETSASAIFTYGIAHAIDQGWVSGDVYGPMVLLAWNAVSTKVNPKGQIEGTCVGTGMGFDPAFYCYRPQDIYAAHAYGPLLLAGAEMVRMLKTQPFKIDDGAMQFYSSGEKKP